MDDELRLVRAMAQRDQSAWALMYERHVGSVFGVVYHLLGGDRCAAEEVCQDVWLLAIERFEQFNPRRGQFRDWVLGIARHRVSRHYRGLNGRSSSGCPDAPSDTVPPPDSLERAEQADLVRAALLCLDDDRRQVLLDKYLREMPVAEIAARMGRSAKAVESLLSRARDQLRRLLRPYVSTATGGERHESSDARPA